MNMNFLKKKKRNGFTLLELLVAMAVIAILATLLLPALAMSRRRVIQITCQNNLKQMGYAMKNYSIDYNADFPTDGVSGKTSLNILISYNYLEDPRVLYCPAGDGEETSTPDYFYAYQLDDNSKPTSPLAIDDDLNHENPHAYNALYVDGHVDRVDTPFAGALAPID